MRIFIFKSETQLGLHAFAGDPGGNSLPKNRGPWTAIGVVRPENALPHNISRETVEKAIEAQGVQMWRMKKAEATT